MENRPSQLAGTTSSRSFLGRSLAVGAGAAGAGLLLDGIPALTAEPSGGLTTGDAAILRFLAAAEIIESDLWPEVDFIRKDGVTVPYSVIYNVADGKITALRLYFTGPVSA